MTKPVNIMHMLFLPQTVSKPTKRDFHLIYSKLQDIYNK